MIPILYFADQAEASVTIFSHNFIQKKIDLM